MACLNQPLTTERVQLGEGKEKSDAQVNKYCNGHMDSVLDFFIGLHLFATCCMSYLSSTTGFGVSVQKKSTSLCIHSKYFLIDGIHN